MRRDEAIQRALGLDDTLAELHVMLAGRSAWANYDWEGAEASFQRAIELNPNLVNGRTYYGNYLMLMRRPDEALNQIKRALELDPFSRLVHMHYGQLLESAGRYDELIEHCHTMLEKSPNHEFAPLVLGCAYYAKGMYEDALEFDKVNAEVKSNPELVQALVQGYEEGGYPGAWHRAAETLVAQSGSDNFVHNPLPVVWYYAMAGKNQEALDWLERGIDERDPGMPYVTQCVRARNLRHEPRYKQLLRRMNFPEDVIARILEESP
jgi:tetratricopeptide (TPR) repeat protein